VLDNVHGAPAGCEARGGVDGLEDAETESSGSDLGDAARPDNLVASDSVCLLAQLAVLALGVIDEGLRIEVCLVLEVLEAEDGVVEAIFFVTVYAAGFGELDRDWR
jgi:hypothetical protein